MFEYPDEDRISCEHCGLRYYPEVGFHTCPQSQLAARLATEAADRQYMGSGRKVVINIAIEIECYNTPQAVQAALDCIELNTMKELNKQTHIEGDDDVLDCRYSMTRTVRKIL